MGVTLEYGVNKAVWHTDKIKRLQEGKPIVPTEIQVDLEAFCNDNCSFCSYRKKDGYNAKHMLPMIKGESNTNNKAIGKPSPESRIPDQVVLDLADQMVKAGIPAIEITGGGEPTLHPKFPQLVKLLGEAKRQIGVVTNGSRLNDNTINLLKKYCTWIRISMDSSNPETHRKIHRTPNYDFEKRLNNIRKLVENKPKDLVIGISFIITPDNIHDIENSAKLFSTIGVNHIRFSWMYDKQGTAGLTQEQIDHISVLIPKLQDELDTDDFKIFNERNRIQLYSQPNDFDTCNFQRFVMAIGADSKVYPCCIMKYNPDFAYASLKENTLAEIVYSMNTHNFMKSLDPKRCYPCWLRNRNASINAAVKKPIHENFI